MSSKITRDIGEMQDMYRRTLAASYSSQIHELPADECIEDIFSGGDGWGKKNGGVTFQDPFDDSGAEESDSEHLSASSQRHVQSKQKAPFRPGNKRDQPDPARNGGAHGNDPQAQSSSSDDHARRRHHRTTNEVSEFDVREDLRSWKISAP